MGLRWRTQKELVSGRGQFVCGAKVLGAVGMQQLPHGSSCVAQQPFLCAWRLLQHAGQAQQPPPGAAGTAAG